ncbi:MAG TPA: class I SAM-dependent methyltransferase [Archangium sp.]|nr:class I SAM-dependent methyltransferase [Archangium sp.]
MAAQYGQLAGKFLETNELAVRLVEGYSLRKALGSMEGQDALDLGCGAGLYTRYLKQWGAARCMGVDISQEMVQNARRSEQEVPLGIEYHVADVAEMPDLGTFDVALAVYVLHYAHSREHLLRMCRRIHAHLSPGGRFVTYVANPDFSAQLPNNTRYGVTVLDFPASPQEGQGISVVLHTQPPITIHYFYWSGATYEWALREAGFRDITWSKPSCPPEGLGGQGPAFWRDYTHNPQSVVLRAER